MNIYVRPGGETQAIYSEDINLAEIGVIDIKRASHVEPSQTERGKWLADLAPVNGPVLGPFSTRREALEAEVAWLDEKLRHGPIRVNTSEANE